MRYVERPVPPELDGVVTRLWFVTGPRRRRFEKILPLPFVHLVVNGSQPYRLFDANGGAVVVDGAFLSGIQPRYLVTEQPDLIGNAGAEFTPAGIGAVTAVPATSIAARVQDAAAVVPGSGALAAAVHRAVVSGGDPNAALDAIAAALVAALRPGWAPDPLVMTAIDLLQDPRDLAVGEVAQACGVSHRTLIARFRRACGVAPKAFADTWRFYRLVSSLPLGGPMPTWADIAASSHCYDQPHFVHTFRRLAGVTPTRYLELAAQFGPEAAVFVPIDEVPVGQ